MTNSVNSPANAPGTNDPTKRVADQKGPSAGAPTNQTHVPTGAKKDAGAGSGDDSSKRATPVAPSSVSQPVKAAASPTPAATNVPGSRPEEHTPAVGGDRKIASPAVKDVSHVQPQSPNSAAGPSGPTGGIPVPTQSQGVRQSKTDAPRPVVSPAPTVASPAAGTTLSPAVGAPPSGRTSPGDPTPIVPNDPAQPKRPAPVQSAHVAQPAAGASPAAGDAAASS